MSVKGFIELSNLQDYYKKLLWNFQNFKHNEEDIYIAFDFFVTALHLLDWLSEDPLEMGKMKKEIKKHPEIKTIEHLAIGAKHFVPDRNRHSSIEKAEKEWVLEEGIVEEGLFENPLMIYLEGATKTKIGPKIKAIELAERVMEIYRTELTERGLIQ